VRAPATAISQTNIRPGVAVRHRPVHSPRACRAWRGISLLRRADSIRTLPQQLVCAARLAGRDARQPAAQSRSLRNMKSDLVRRCATSPSSARAPQQQPWDIFLPPLRDYDEPETLPSSNQPVCRRSVYGEQTARPFQKSSNFCDGIGDPIARPDNPRRSSILGYQPDIALPRCNASMFTRYGRAAARIGAAYTRGYHLPFSTPPHMSPPRGLEVAATANNHLGQPLVEHLI